MEIWKDVIGYEGRYQVSNEGRVRSLNYNQTGITKVLSPGIHTGGYPQVGLYGRGKRKALFVHRLVAIAFIPNPLNLPQVNHKDENVANAHVSNLEWCDQAYNNDYTRLRNPEYNQKAGETRKGRVAEWARKPVLQFNLKGTFINKYESLAEATTKTGISRYSIGKCCSGRLKTGGGYLWRYASLDTPRENAG